MTLIVCRAEIPFPCTSKLVMIWSFTAFQSNWAVWTLNGCNSSITLHSVNTFYTKRWYFFLHVARCVIISPFFLFSLSQSVWHRFLTSLSPFNRHSCLLFSAMPTWWRITPSFFVLFVCFLHSTTALPFPFFPSFLVSLSQCDGLSGWFLRCRWSLCKYTSLSSTASLLPTFSPLLPVGFSSVKQHGPNP